VSRRPFILLLAALLAWACNVTPIPLTPEQRQDWREDPTAYPPLGGVRDAGADR